jgi:hypothetical protein
MLRAVRAGQDVREIPMLRVQRSEASAVLPGVQGAKALQGLLLSAEDH